MEIIDLRPEAPRLGDEAAALLLASFLGRSSDWPDIESARAEVVDSLSADRISRVALDAGRVVGWIGALSTYGGHSWELHPLVVDVTRRRQGIGRALVEDLENILALRGAHTLWLGSDDEHEETSLSRVDVYADVPGAIRGFSTIRGEHPCGFYLKLGFTIVGVLPDANGRGKPDIFFAKRVPDPGVLP